MVVLLVQVVELELEYEENLLVHWVVKYLEEGMEIERVAGTRLGSCGRGSFFFFCFTWKFAKG